MSIAEKADGQNPAENQVWNEWLADNSASITLRRLDIIPPAPDVHFNDREFAIEIFDVPRTNLLDALATTLTNKVNNNSQPNEAPNALPHIERIIDRETQVDYFLDFAVIAGKGGLDTETFFEHAKKLAEGVLSVPVLRKIALTKIELGVRPSEAFQGIDEELDRQITSAGNVYSVIDILLQGEDVIWSRADHGDWAGILKTYDTVLGGENIIPFDDETMAIVAKARRKVAEDQT